MPRSPGAGVSAKYTIAGPEATTAACTRMDRVLNEHALEDVAADVAVLLEGEALEVAVVSK